METSIYQVDPRRETFALDKHRPGYHFVAPANWMNHPNGLMYWGGHYHLFYQHNPGAPVWGNMHWGHAVSEDLVRWYDLPIALAPTPDGPDAQGCCSGCAIEHEGTPALIYTGLDPEVQCLAVPEAGADGQSDPEGDGLLRRWAKSESGRPVIPERPAGLDLEGFRDPFVWLDDFGDGPCFHLLLGSGLKGRGGTALLYRSPLEASLRQWEFIGPILVGDPSLGDNWECPNLFRLTDPAGEPWWVLVVSAQPLLKALYFTGRFDGRQFEPVVQGVVDGGRAYAPLTFQDPRGRRILMAWSSEARSRQLQVDAGWAGALTLPRVLSIDTAGRLRSEAIPELVQLRHQPMQVGPQAIEPGPTHWLGEVAGEMLELEARFDLGDAEDIGLVLRSSSDHREQTRIIFDRSDQRLLIDPSASTFERACDLELAAGHLEIADDEPLHLHVFLDRSILEVYANSRLVLTQRIYPTCPDSRSVGLLAWGGTAELSLLEAWRMQPIWPVELSSASRP